MTVKHRHKPYMPDSDLGKKLWMERFITKLESDPERYGFNDPRMFEYISRTIRTFIKAADAVKHPATRTPGAVKAKNQARKEAVQMCRDIAMQLKWDSSLTDDEKQSLGIHIDEATPEKAKLPESMTPGALGYPKLAVLNSPNGGHVIRYRDNGSIKTLKAKPKGVSHLLLFAAIGAKPNMSNTHARLLGAYTKRPFEIIYPTSCGLEGLYVTYFARWLTTRGEMSPWSPGISKIIGETLLPLRECKFGHLFGKEEVVDALPEGSQEAARGVVEFDETRPLLEGAVREAEGESLFESLMGGREGSQRMLEATRVRLLDAA